MTYEDKIQFVLELLAFKIVNMADHSYHPMGVSDGEKLRAGVEQFFDNAMSPRTIYQDNSGGLK